jgi:hypothetical protein
VFHAKGDYVMALQHAETALQIYEDELGVGHPEYARTLRLCGKMICGQGRVGEALVMVERALGIQETTLGVKHPDYASTMEMIATLRGSMSSMGSMGGGAGSGEGGGEGRGAGGGEE